MFNEEIRNRIIVAVAAYAYEIENAPIMSDGDFDILALRIKPEKQTGDEVLDDFFRSNFDPSTGLWIHSHPSMNGIRSAWIRNFKRKGVTMKIKPTSYDQQNNHDLFGLILVEPEVIRNPCRVCGKDTLKNPVYGGCHC